MYVDPNFISLQGRHGPEASNGMETPVFRTGNSTRAHHHLTPSNSRPFSQPPEDQSALVPSDSWSVVLSFLLHQLPAFLFGPSVVRLHMIVSSPMLGTPGHSRQAFASSQTLQRYYMYYERLP